jgi:DNA-binding winged helix-turn-helix (wHTH) protein
MASKTFSIYNANPGHQLRRTAASELQVSGQAQPTVMALLPPSIASPKEDSGFRHLQTDLLGSENYQVALVPPAKPVPRFALGASDTAPQILLLPLTWKQLLARVHAEVDHARSPQQSVVMFGNIRVDLFRSEVSRSETPVDLTAMEFKLLRFFMACPGRVISRDELLTQVWGFQNYPTTRTVDNHVWRLRKKLEPDPACPVHFQTVHCVGYKFVPEASRSAAEQQT